MFLEICMQSHSVVFALSRQISKQKVYENSCLRCASCGDLCVVASRDFSIVKRWLLPQQLGAVGVCISLRSLNAPFSVIAVKCCCRCHRT